MLVAFTLHVPVQRDGECEYEHYGGVLQEEATKETSMLTLEMLLKKVFFRDVSENLAPSLGIAGGVFNTDDDDPFIVLTETKFSFRCIPVGIGTLLTGLGSTKKHM